MSMIDEHHLTEVHQCFSCELRFRWHTELDQHLRAEHPDVHVAYSSGREPVVPQPRAAST